MGRLWGTTPAAPCFSVRLWSDIFYKAIPRFEILLRLLFHVGYQSFYPEQRATLSCAERQYGDDCRKTYFLDKPVLESGPQNIRYQNEASQGQQYASGGYILPVVKWTMMAQPASQLPAKRHHK